MILEIVIVVALGLAMAVGGIRIGMLLAPRVARRLDREDNTDDRTE